MVVQYAYASLHADIPTLYPTIAPLPTCRAMHAYLNPKNEFISSISEAYDDDDNSDL